MSEKITLHQGQVVYQNDRQNLNLPADLAARFYPVMQAWLRREIDDALFYQKHEMALAEAKERLGLVEQVTQFATTTLQTQATNHQAECDRMMAVISSQHEIIKLQSQAGVDIARASNSGDQRVEVHAEIQPRGFWLYTMTGDEAVFRVIIAGCFFSIAVGFATLTHFLVKSAAPTPVNHQMPGVVNRVY